LSFRRGSTAWRVLAFIGQKGTARQLNTVLVEFQGFPWKRPRLLIARLAHERDLTRASQRHVLDERGRTFLAVALTIRRQVRLPNSLRQHRSIAGPRRGTTDDYGGRLRLRPAVTVDDEAQPWPADWRLAPSDRAACGRGRIRATPPRTERLRRVPSVSAGLLLGVGCSAAGASIDTDGSLITRLGTSLAVPDAALRSSIEADVVGAGRPELGAAFNDRHMVVAPRADSRSCLGRARGHVLESGCALRGERKHQGRIERGAVACAPPHPGARRFTRVAVPLCSRTVIVPPPRSGKKDRTAPPIPTGRFDPLPRGNT